MHLSQHAHNFGILVNTAVGVKEMVHHIFKGIVPHTNCKIIELDLTQCYNTMQALQHLVDSWTDSWFDISTNVFTNLTTDPLFCSIFLNWYATENILPIIS